MSISAGSSEVSISSRFSGTHSPRTSSGSSASWFRSTAPPWPSRHCRWRSCSPGRRPAASTLVSVRPRKGVKSNGNDAKPAPGLEAYLERMAWSLRRGGLAVETSIRSGRITEEIGRLAMEIKADVIVMATHGRSPVDRLLGRNIATAVVRQTDLPVLLVRPTEAWTSRTTAFQKLLVCLDGSEGSEEVLPWARIISRHFGSQMVLITVPEAESEVPRLEQYLGSVAAALRNIGFAAEVRVTGSGAVQTITAVAASEGCDLIMMATRGRGAPDDIDTEVGSVTERVVQAAHCPVFAVTVLGLAADRPAASATR